MTYEENDECTCENCEGEIGSIEPLTITIYNHGETATRHTEISFCSWRCVFEYIPSISCDYFVDLPYLHFDDTGIGTIDEFLKVTKKCQ